jgi:uncharacterized surface protein with fasciclin (FAS1) repeats
MQMITTVEGKNATVRVSGSTLLINSAKVTAADNLATNGVVHIIDAVLMPSDAPKPSTPQTIVDLAAASPDLSTLVTALKAADLVGTLSGKGPFTVFAPTNEAFAALPPGTLTNLLKPENKAQLVDLLTYHVDSGRVLAKDLMDMQMITTVEGKNATVRVSGRTILINSAKVTAADNLASNGVVHIIDAVLMPSDAVCKPMTDSDSCFKGCHPGMGCTTAKCAELGKVGCGGSMCTLMGASGSPMAHCMSMGMAPEDVTDSPEDRTPEDQGSGKKDKKFPTYGIVLIVIAAIAVVGGAGAFMWKRSRGVAYQSVNTNDNV